jgi:hypothetical protein
MDRWAHLGHRLGECWVDSSARTTYIHIPKNASSYIKGCVLSTNKWQHSDTLVQNEKYLVALRDPVDRWTSGMAQYQINSNQFDLSDEEIFNTITFDDHTEQQLYFLEGVNLLSCDFILVNDQLTTTLNKWFTEKYSITVDHLPKYNSSEGVKLEIKQRLTDTLKQNPNLMSKLKEHFRIDYELINRVKFYD